MKMMLYNALWESYTEFSKPLSVPTLLGSTVNLKDLPRYTAVIESEKFIEPWLTQNEIQMSMVVLTTEPVFKGSSIDRYKFKYSYEGLNNQAYVNVFLDPYEKIKIAGSGLKGLFKKNINTIFSLPKQKLGIDSDASPLGVWTLEIGLFNTDIEKFDDYFSEYPKIGYIIVGPVFEVPIEPTREPGFISEIETEQTNRGEIIPTKIGAHFKKIQVETRATIDKDKLDLFRFCYEKQLYKGLPIFVEFTEEEFETTGVARMFCRLENYDDIVFQSSIQGKVAYSTTFNFIEVS